MQTAGWGKPAVGSLRLDLSVCMLLACELMLTMLLLPCAGPIATSRHNAAASAASLYGWDLQSMSIHAGPRYRVPKHAGVDARKQAIRATAHTRAAGCRLTAPFNIHDCHHLIVVIVLNTWVKIVAYEEMTRPRILAEKTMHARWYRSSFAQVVFLYGLARVSGRCEMSYKVVPKAVRGWMPRRGGPKRRSVAW